MSTDTIQSPRVGRCDNCFKQDFMERGLCAECFKRFNEGPDGRRRHPLQDEGVRLGSGVVTPWIKPAWPSNFEEQT